MLFMTTYKVKPYLPRSETKKFSTCSPKVGEAPRTIAHYVAADNSCGWAITDQDDATSGYAAVLFNTRSTSSSTRSLSCKMEDAMAHLLEAHQ